MESIRDYPCEACQGIIQVKRTRCPKCGKVYCKYHINDHKCESEQNERKIN